jgi:hypothetical protein
VNVITEEPDPDPLLSAAVRRSAISMWCLDWLP